MEPGDTPEWLAKAFAYPGMEELAKLNGLIDPSKLHSGMKIWLPGWYFFYARRGDTLEHIDELFGLPKGSSRTVGKVHHPDPSRFHECETIAVPSKMFVKTYMTQGEPIEEPIGGTNRGTNRDVRKYVNNFF
jgi:hypothetical protein